MEVISKLFLVILVVAFADICNGALLNPENFNLTARQQDVKYMKTQNAAGWNTARQDCEDLAEPGTRMRMVEIPFQSDYEALKEFLGDDDTGNTYWIGAKYSRPSRYYVWQSTGFLLPGWFPWGDNQPGSPSPAKRVVYRVLDERFSTNFGTASMRAICEFY